MPFLPFLVFNTPSGENSRGFIKFLSRDYRGNNRRVGKKKSNFFNVNF